MATKHDAKRAAKKHAKEQKRKANLAKRAAAGRPAPAAARKVASPDPRAARRSDDPVLDALLDEVDLARLDPRRRAEAFRRLLELDALLAAEGGVERFRRLDALEDMARLWLSIRVGTEAGDPIEQAAPAIARLLPELPSDDLELQLALALEALLFRLGRGDEALDRILLKGELEEFDLDNATSAVLDSEFGTREHLLRVRAACVAWTPAAGQGEMRDLCVEALDEALATRED